MLASQIPPLRGGKGRSILSQKSFPTALRELVPSKGEKKGSFATFRGKGRILFKRSPPLGEGKEKEEDLSASPGKKGGSTTLGD